MNERHGILVLFDADAARLLLLLAIHIALAHLGVQELTERSAQRMATAWQADDVAKRTATCVNWLIGSYFKGIYTY